MAKVKSGKPNNLDFRVKVELLTRRRLELGLSVTELIKRSDVSRNTWYTMMRQHEKKRWMKGHLKNDELVAPQIGTLRSLCEVLKLPMSKLFDFRSKHLRAKRRVPVELQY